MNASKLTGHARKIIRDRERRFNKATPAGKRVLVAKDVLRQIKAGLIKPTSGLWLDTKHGVGSERTGQLRDELNGVGCSACALGSMFVCLVGRRNNLTVGEMSGVYGFEPSFVGRQNSNMGRYMGDVFDIDQLDLIEVHFERRSRAYPGKYFATKYDDATVRLVDIMRNIIRNKGEFIPERA